MGQPEFSTPLSSFNQEQLDAIQESSDEILAAVTAIQNTDIAALNDKVGTSADAAAVATLFGNLAKIIGSTSGLDGKIGPTNDGEASATLFGKLAKIIGSTSLLDGKIGPFAYGDTVYSLLRSYIGMDGPFATDADGYGIPRSVLAWVSQVHRQLEKLTINHPRQAIADVSANAGSFYDIVNVSGRGTINRVSANVLSGNLQIHVTVDGENTIYYNNTAATFNNTGGRVDAFPGASFDTSLKVSLLAGVSTTLSGEVDYGLY